MAGPHPLLDSYLLHPHMTPKAIGIPA